MQALFAVNGGRSRRANAISFTTIAADVSLDQHEAAEQSDRPEWVGSGQLPEWSDWERGKFVTENIPILNSYLK